MFSDVLSFHACRVVYRHCWYIAIGRGKPPPATTLFPSGESHVCFLVSFPRKIADSCQKKSWTKRDGFDWKVPSEVEVQNRKVYSCLARLSLTNHQCQQMFFSDVIDFRFFFRDFETELWPDTVNLR